MKKCVLSIVLFTSFGFVVEAKSTMELLINKDWHELDITSMKAKESYVRFTGTQRMIVSADSAGNTIAKAQRYYLSNRYEDTFDSTKVICIISNTLSNFCIITNIFSNNIFSTFNSFI